MVDQLRSLLDKKTLILSILFRCRLDLRSAVGAHNCLTLVMYFKSKQLRINSPPVVPLCGPCGCVSLCFEMIEGRGVEMKKTCSHLCSFVPKISRMRCHQSWLSMYVSVVFKLARSYGSDRHSGLAMGGERVNLGQLVLYGIA